MKKSFGLTAINYLTLMFLALFWFSTNSYAEENGGSNGYKKLQPFTVNLAGLTNFLQLSVTLKLSSPKIEDKIVLYMPAIQNEIIMLLSSKTIDQMKSPSATQQLILELKNAINKALGLTSGNGVSDVLIESMLIQ